MTPGSSTEILNDFAGLSGPEAAVALIKLPDDERSIASRALLLANELRVSQEHVGAVMESTIVVDRSSEHDWRMD